MQKNAKFKYIMKRIILILVVALLPIAANAQYIGGAKYKDIKNTYNYKNYQPSQVDPYSPGLSGAFSFFVPGSGQILSGEVWRGVAFMAGGAVLTSFMSDSWEDLGKCIAINQEQNTISWTDKANGQKDLWIIGVCAVADLGLAIWSSIDASHIAKVKNMYYQDMLGRRAAVEMNLAPSFAFTPAGNVAPGMGLTINF
jgi:hypothetical protein